MGNFIKKWPGVFLLFFLFVISTVLMWKTFRLTPEGNLQIATKVWSDFGATIPLIRSFSLGSNFPPEYPIFAGPPIRYHFIFYALVGILEKVGLPLNWALNSLSSISFFLLLCLIYLLGRTLFNSKTVGFISVILFLFNGSFGFLEFFKKHPLGLNTLSDIVGNNEFSAFGPYDRKSIVSAFWSLNIFTNQRHLALAYAAFLLLVFIIYKYSKTPNKLIWNKTLLIGLFVGMFPFIHMAVFGTMGIALIILFLLYPKLRLKITIIGIAALALAVPQILYMGKSEIEASFFNPGYLVGTLTISNFLKYWFLNLGLTIILAPIGFILADKDQRKILLPFLALFVVGNLFQFTPEVAANHKFFNLFVVGLNFFTALLLIKLWKRHVIGKIATISLLLPLTLTGIIDLFPILNDRYMEVADIPNNPTATYITKSTAKDAVFLNAMFINDPASLAGRKIYLGWPYFSWSAGYDTMVRSRTMKQILEQNDKNTVCRLLIQEKIDYIETQNPSPYDDIATNYIFFDQNFKKVYFNPESNINIYDVPASCQNSPEISF